MQKGIANFAWENFDNSNVRLEKGVVQSIHGGVNKQDERRGNIFGKTGNTGV